MDSVNEGVIAKLKQRAERGRAKYGVTMDREDLTMLEWLQHAQDEVMDAAVYLEKLIRLNGACKWGRMNSACGEVIEVFSTSKQSTVRLDFEDRMELQRLRQFIEEWPKREYLSVDDEHNQQRFLTVLNHIIGHE